MGLETIIRDVVKAQYTDAERAEMSNTIKRFVKLYYDMSKQTWGVTKWMGVHVCKAVTDLWIYQELIYAIKPQMIIETGTRFGGSALFLHDMCMLAAEPANVITIDVTDEVLSEKFRTRVALNIGLHFYKGSSVEKETLDYVKAMIATHRPKRVMVVFDSDHNAEHVKREMELYAPLVTTGSCMIVEDTYPCVELVPMISDWLVEHPEFRRDYMCEKFMLTFNRDGYLAKVDPTSEVDNGI